MQIIHSREGSLPPTQITQPINASVIEVSTYLLASMCLINLFINLNVNMLFTAVRKGREILDIDTKRRISIAYKKVSLYLYLYKISYYDLMVIIEN